MLRIDPRNPKAVELGRLLEKRLEPGALPENLCLVLGGDGMMLRAVHELGDTHILLGLNCGTLGFLLNDVSDPDEIVHQVRERNYKVFAFPRILMQAELATPTTDDPEFRNGNDTPPLDIRPGSVHRALGLAFNDVYVERMEALSCHLRLAINGITVVDQLVCDGIIIATSIGSTGYSVSAGGPACHPLVRSLHITPICPRNPRFMPLVVPMSSRVEVWPLDAERRPVRAVLDWRGFPHPRHLVVEDAQSDVRLAFLGDHDFTETMIRKVLLA